MKFHVLGKGFIYSKHAEAIKAVGGVEVDSYDEADYIVILTPSYLHYEQTMEALDKGKKVIVEKPLALSSRECQKIEVAGKSRVFPIMQMRYLFGGFGLNRKKLNLQWNNIEIRVRVYRDENFFKSWKGDEEKSGGILLNLGIHYIDLVTHIFGQPTAWVNGIFEGVDYACHYEFSYDASKNSQVRLFRINGREYNLETKENLHIKAYRDIINNKLIPISEICNLVKLIEQLKSL